jgi:sulfhydrogenase subunit beta (sulfur reductase)
MAATGVRPGDQVVIDPVGLQSLIDALRADGRTVVGPTVRDGALGYAEIDDVAALPRGVGDSQDAGSYRLRRRGDDALFGYASGAQSFKPWLFPSRQLLWSGQRTEAGFTVEPAEDEPRRLALLGVRGCDLQAIAVQDRVLNRPGRPAVDAHYAAQLDDLFVVAVACSDPGGTCFCASMGTGPHPGEGADLILTELDVPSDHRFLVEVVTLKGADLLDAGVALRPATEADRVAAAAVVEDATGRMGRTLEVDGLRDLLYQEVDSPHWDDVASRCLSCTNCTLVCPTCFCTSVQDVADLTGDQAQRWRVWDSCFTAGFSYIHGGSVRESTRSRYRQWMTHKLGAWHDQFGSSGCVGCGRCITWCPAAIDITAEAAALSAAARPRED